MDHGEITPELEKFIIRGWIDKASLGFFASKEIKDLYHKFHNQNTLSNEEIIRNGAIKNVKSFLMDPNTTKVQKARFRKGNTYTNRDEEIRDNIYDVYKNDDDFEWMEYRGEPYRDIKWSDKEYYPSPKGTPENDRAYLDNDARFASRNYRNLIKK